MSLDTILRELNSARQQTAVELEQITSAIRALQSGNHRTRRRHMSPEAIERIRAAQRKRWKAWRRAKG